MIPPEVQYSVFNSVAIHDPFFDRLPAEDYLLTQQQQDNFGNPTLNGCASELDMFPPPQEHYPFRRMSADTQSSAADSAAFSPNQKPAHLTDAKNVVLPPILSLNHDNIPRPISPEANSSDASSGRSPPLSASASWHAQHQHSLANFQFPPLDPEPARHPRPQLSINPDQRHLPGAYPTPSTGNYTPGYPGLYSPHDRMPTHPRIAPGYLPTPATGRVSPASWTDANSASSDASKPHFEQLMLTGDVASYPTVVPPPPQIQHQQQQRPPATNQGVSMGPPNPMISQHPQRRRGKLPKPVTEFLKKWLLAHTEHPYPTEDEKKWLCAETGLSMSQVSNWMINARRRILAPAAKANAAAATTTAPYYNRPGAGIRSVSSSSAISTSPTAMGSYNIPPSYNAPQTGRRGSYGGYGTPVSSRPPSSHPSPYGVPSNGTYGAQAQPVNGGYGYGYPPPPSGLTGPGVYSAPTYTNHRDMAQGSPHAHSPSGDYAFPAPTQ